MKITDTHEKVLKEYDIKINEWKRKLELFNIKLQDITQVTNIDQSTISNYIHKKNVPSFRRMIQISIAIDELVKARITEQTLNSNKVQTNLF